MSALLFVLATAFAQDPDQPVAEPSEPTPEAAVPTAPEAPPAPPEVPPAPEAPPAPPEVPPAPAVAAQDEPSMLLKSVPQSSPKLSLSAELGSSGVNDDAFYRFSNGTALPTRGLRVGYRAMKRLEAQVGWHHGARGATVETVDEGGETIQPFATAYYADRFSLGARLDVSIDDVLLPYIVGRGQLALQRIRVDGDSDTKNNSDQLQETAIAPGAELLAGIEVRVPQGMAPLTVALTLEMGVETLTTAQFGDLGDMRAQGFVVHSGLGVRF